MITVGIHIGHDGGCAISRDGQVIVAIAEERLARHKHHNGWWNSLRYCLNSSGILPRHVDVIVVSNSGDPTSAESLASILGWGFNSKVRIITCDHHLSHAVGAVSLSGMECGLAFVGDAGGNHLDTESAYLFERNDIQRIYINETRPKYRGLGTTYEAFTNLLGFADEESGKTMALAAYGNPTAFEHLELFRVSSDCAIYGMLSDSHRWGAMSFLKERGVSLDYATLANTHSQEAKDVACLIQASFTKVLTEVVRKLSNDINAEAVIISGGIALNCSANRFLRNVNGGKKFFVSPCSSDIGLAIGNAVYGYLKTTGTLPRQLDISGCYGKNYTREEIANALQRRPDDIHPGPLRKYSHQYYISSDVVGEATEFIGDCKVIGWFEGGSESGPRALGRRSMIASASYPGIRDHINVNIKRREWFRPFGPSILNEELELLNLSCLSNSRMTEAAMIDQAHHGDLANCIHVDATSRVHGVGDSDSSRFSQLLRRLRRDCGAKGVLNTSFNVYEPIVETPSDALATFLRSEIDVLIMHDYVITKKSL